jgi:hypothetical protein
MANGGRKYVAERAAGQHDHARCVTARTQRFGQVRIGFDGARLDQLQRDHRAAATYLADAIVLGLQSAKPVLHQRLDLTCALHQAVGLDRCDGGQRRGARDRIAAVGAAEPAHVR